MKNKFIIAPSIFTMLILLALPQSVLSQGEVSVVGHVVGYQLYQVQATTIPQMNTLLFKVARVMKGKEKSEYILIKLWKQALDADYANDDFGVGKLKQYRLERHRYCDEKITRFTESAIPDERNRFVGYSEIFVLVPGIYLEDLPRKKRMPCYVESRSDP